MIKPLDVVVFHASKWSPIHWCIELRSFSKYVHCLVVKDGKGNVFDPTIGGILDRNISHYQDDKVTVCRFKQSIDLLQINKMLLWCQGKQDICEGYDYLAWLGFATSLVAFEDEERWFCSELPYWMFMENGYKLTNEELKFPFPCEFVRNPLFEIVYTGKISGWI